MYGMWLKKKQGPFGEEVLRQDMGKALDHVGF